MSTTTKRRWWRVAAVAVVAGGAIGVARYASAEPIKPPLAPKDDPAVWARSAQVAPPAVNVVPASTAFPVPPMAVPASDPPAFGPRAPLAQPALPGELPGIPPAPKAVDISPVAPPLPLVAPPAALPLPSPAPFVPPPPEVAQPAPPVKWPDPVKPFSPVVPDFNLQSPKTGNSVRGSDPAPPAGLPVAPVLPPVTTPIPSVAGARGDVPATAVDRPKPIEMPLLDSEKFTFPLPTTTAPPPTPPPGDPIMMNYFKQSALAAVIGSALAAAPLSPVTAQAKTDPPTPAELKRALDDTNAKVAEVDASLKRLTELLDGRKDEKGFKLESDPGVVTEVKRLKDTVTSLQTQLDAMKRSESLRPPGIIPPAADAMAGKGTVRVVNDYPVEISIVVNEQSYRVAPNTKKDVPVPTGDFTYQLLQNGAAAKKSTITEKEVVTLRIR